MNSFEEWCKDNHVVFVAPDPKNWKPEWVFQFDKVTRKLYKKPLSEIEFGRESIIMNHMRLCTIVRSVVEQLFAAVAQASCPPAN